MKSRASFASIQLPWPARPTEEPTARPADAPTAQLESAFMCAWNGTAPLAPDKVVWQPDRATRRMSRRAGDLVLAGWTVAEARDEARRIAASEPIDMKELATRIVARAGDLVQAGWTVGEAWRSAVREPVDMMELATRLVERGVQMGRDIHGLVDHVQLWLEEEQDMLDDIARLARRTDPMSVALSAELTHAVRGHPAQHDIALLFQNVEDCLKDDARMCRARIPGCADTIGSVRRWWFEQNCRISRCSGYYHMCRVRHEDKVRNRMTAEWLAHNVPPGDRVRELDRVRRMDDRQIDAYVAATERTTRMLAAGVHPTRDVDLLDPSVAAPARSTL